jgi:WD40 repeat protein
MLYWDLETGRIINRLEGHNGAITGIDISEDGKFAVSASMDGQVGYWDLVEGKMLRRMTGYVKARGATDAHFLPGERLAISSGWDGTMAIWDLATGEQVRRLTGLEGLAGSHLEDTDFDTVAFEISVSQDGRYLLSAGDDESVLLWDLASGQSIRRLIGHGDNVTTVRFTPDGQRALSSARNEALVLWDVNTGKPVRQFSTRTSSDGGFTPALAIHPDGATALTDDADGSILQWQLAEPLPLELIDWLAANRTMRELTCIERETYRIEPLCTEGTQVDSTDDMLATARKTTAALTPALQPAGTPAPVAILEESAPARPPKVARLGDNRGELPRHGFDVWTYEGKADEVLSIQMIADNPLTDQTLPVNERYEKGVMDTVLYVLRPDGTLLSKTDDDVAPDGTRSSDANILATMLPEDGVYRIEARSALDDHAGGYTLRIKPLERVWNEELFKEYVGVYLDGPWEYHLFVFMQDGRLYDYVQEGGYVEEYFPISETEFVLTDGIVERFTRDESGKVDGYDVYISLIHPVGGRWYRGNRIGDLPEDFYETLNNVLLEDGTP